nr:TonB-dependent receptor [uncultured Flavobacterium sp.]
MKNFKQLILLLFLVTTQVILAQNARVKGIVLDKNKQPITNVSITNSVNSENTLTNENGFYILNVPAKQPVTLQFTHIGFKKTTVKVTLKPNEDFEFNIEMNDQVEQLGEIIVSKSGRKRVEGITSIEPQVIRLIPGANAGVENILKTLPGVYSNNELSTSYAVRGGNYDENLVYVNEIEVYRPFLIRSGQQEGLSFTNTDMVQNVDFSAGGFQAKYGDKLASVLDITYRRPTKFQAIVNANFLGAAGTLDYVTKNQKIAGITSVRYRNNAMLVNSQETEANYKPRFFDIQQVFNFDLNAKWELSFLGNISKNQYHYQPVSRQTNFGTIDNPIALIINYDGQEKDEYTTYFGAFKATQKISDQSKIKYIASVYNTKEQEYYDIEARYRLGEVDTNIGSETFGDVIFSRGAGGQLTHARNNLDALIANFEIKGNHNLANDNQIEWGLKYTHEDIRDRLIEWEQVDSAGYNLPNLGLGVINDQPYQPYTGPLAPYNSVRATNFVKINRVSGYTQWNKRGSFKNADYFFNAGVRAHYWQINAQGYQSNTDLTISPRAQFSIKPYWKADMLFRISGGLYHQPPFYRELRKFDGTLNPEVKAQQSIHVVLGNDYSFKLADRPFTLTSEAYYKKLSDVNAYTIDNVRMRYFANNDAEAYVYGADFRLYGEFVPGTESWFTFGYLKTEEKHAGKDWIARPTDQRLKFALLFQDYMPNLPRFKMYLNLVYNTGLPGGSPSYADPYEYQTRLDDYKRVDAGFSYVFKDAKQNANANWLKPFKELTLGFEIFNMFNNQNAITNTWVRDVYTKSQYAVPNYMTNRVFSVKLSARL